MGGGNGALLAGILKANPRLRGIVFDQPHVAERAREHLRAEGFAERCQVVGHPAPRGHADPESLEALVPLLRDPKSKVRLFAVLAARQMRRGEGQPGTG